MSSLRQLALFLILGLALFGLKQALRAAPVKPVLVVHVPERATNEEIERAVDEAVLVDQGLSRGSVLLDPVVRDQLLRSMRVAGREAETTQDRELMDRALSLGVHRADPLIRKRLAFQAEQVLRARLRAGPATEEELTRYLVEHEARYRKPARVSFAHVFLSTSRHPGDMPEAVRRMGARLAHELPAPADAFRFSEPTILPLQIARSTETEVAARFGASFASALQSAPDATWHGPITSSYGEHFVHITAREPSALGSLTELRERLVADRERDLKSARVAREVRELRAGYRVEVRRDQVRTQSDDPRDLELMD